MSAIDEALQANDDYARTFGAELPPRPARGLAVLACMDARLDVAVALGLAAGDAHVVRNAGGLATDDAIRSLTISQRLLGTRAVMVVLHTGCGLLGLDDDEFRDRVEQETGTRPSWSAQGFADLEQEVRRQVQRITASPFLPHTDQVRGFVFDVATGRLREVDAV